MSPRLIAVLQAVFVTFLWSTSWVLIKVGLQSDLPALTFAGVRYSLAALVLAPWVLLHPKMRASMRGLSRRTWARLAIYGLILYTLTQGALFLSLSLLPANPVSLVLNLTPVLVAGVTTALGREQPAAHQWAGVAVAAIGTGIFFLPLGAVPFSTAGLLALLFCLGANAASSLMGRAVNRQSVVPALIVTFVSMAAGSFTLLAVGLATQGAGTWTPQSWLIVAWLALVNTALTFTLWNRTLRTLTAVESSILNGLMLPQIVLLAFWFLGETLTARQVVGLLLVAAGTVAVQVQRRRSAPPEAIAFR
ncbi:MAG TPA: DMT family transporter [Anaerolineales bacterium]|nr:DMT family transporter [Anaerolineales bacterium]